jgi:cell division septum initiation protein DivIVA
MKLTDKYDALLQRHMDLEDENKALRRALSAVRSSATPKEAGELDSMVAEDANATDCARAIMITPAVWSAINSIKN